MLLDVSRSRLKISDLGITKDMTERGRETEFMTRAMSQESLISAPMPEIFTLETAKTRIHTADLRWGTPGYIAPEILNLQEYTASVDVFSLGRSLWHMIYRKYNILNKQKESLDIQMPSL